LYAKFEFQDFKINQVTNLLKMEPNISLDDDTDRLSHGYKYSCTTRDVLEKVPPEDRNLLIEQVLSFEKYLGDNPSIPMHIGWHHEWILKALADIQPEQRAIAISKTADLIEGQIGTGLMIAQMLIQNKNEEL
jgi:hypothetical protein